MFRAFLINKFGLLAFVLVTMLPSLGRADTLRGQPIYAKNNTDRTIWVASQYIPPGATSYVVSGWWRVEPGERVLILYNNGRYIYFFARDGVGSQWSGSDARVQCRGETLNMKMQCTGLDFEPWTMIFNP